MLLSFVE